MKHRSGVLVLGAAAVLFSAGAIPAPRRNTGDAPRLRDVRDAAGGADVDRQHAQGYGVDARRPVRGRAVDQSLLCDSHWAGVNGRTVRAWMAPLAISALTVA